MKTQVEKAWQIKHLMSWLNYQFDSETAEKLLDPMLNKMDEDIEYWSQQNYWKLYDALDLGEVESDPFISSKQGRIF